MSDLPTRPLHNQKGYPCWVIIELGGVLKLYGAFNSENEARSWAKRNMQSREWSPRQILSSVD